MLQVNIFWSFGIGASLAILASDGIRRCDRILVNEYFVFTACYLGCFFVPTTMYTLWEYTEWETMFHYDGDSLCGLWVIYFVLTNFLSGCIGFYRVAYLIMEAEDMLIYKYWTLPLTIMSAILTFGYDRTLYAGTKAQYDSGVSYPLTDILSSEVFFALMVMFAVGLPPLMYVMKTWPEKNRITPVRKSIHIEEMHRTLLLATASVLACYGVAYATGYLPTGWGWDRPVAFLIGQCVNVLCFFTPVYLINPPPKKKAT